MITKSHIISFSVLVLLYLITAAWKYSPLLSKQTIDSAVELNTERAGVVKFWDYYNSATSFRTDREYTNAAENYKKALELNMYHEDALYYLGSMMLFLKNFEESEKYWQQLEIIQPNSPRVQLQLGTLYFCMDSSNHLYDLEKASLHVEDAWRLNREDTGSPLVLSKIALLQNDINKAKELISIVTGSNTMSYQAIFLSGYVEWKKGNERSGRELLNRSMNLYQSLAYSDVQGEGATKSGARAMISEDLFCDLFAIEIDHSLADAGNRGFDMIYPDFQEQLSKW